MAGGAVEMYCPSCGHSEPAPAETCPKDGTKLVRLGDPSDPYINKTIEGRFTIREKLGSGGMGTVYRAWQHSLGRDVAIKLIRHDYAVDRFAAKRFLREAQLVSRLAHPHIVSTVDFGQTQDGLLFLVMEYLQGRTLRRVMSQEGRFSAERAIGVGVQLCDALEAAHSVHIVHRDLKPGNVIILDRPPGRDFVKVLDFGLAKSLAGDDTTMTESGEMMGTPKYLSPEVALGEEASVASDLYAIGVMLYELLAGHAPFESKSQESLLVKHAYHSPAPLEADVPLVLQNVVMRLLEKDPTRRYSSAALLREALLGVSGLVSKSSSPHLRREPPPLQLPGVLQAAEEEPSAALVSITRDRPLLSPAAVSRKRRVLAAGGVVLVAVAAIAAALILTSEPEPLVVAPPVIDTSAPVAPATAVEPPPAPAASGAPEVRMVAVRFESAPASKVLIGDQKLDTPAVREFEASDQIVTVKFVRSGYKTISRTFKADKDQTLKVRLEKVAVKEKETDLPF